MFRQLPRVSVVGYGPICMDTNDPHTVECAFKKRLMRDIPKADPKMLTEFSAFVDKWIRSNVLPVRPYDFEEWLLSTTYNEARKDELRVAYEGLRGGLPTRQACQSVSTFVKSEFYDLWKHARMINSRSDSFKVFSGPLFKAIEDEVYKHAAFIKHVPVPERPALIDALRRSGRSYINSDFKAYESHFTAEFMMSCELKLYRYCLIGMSASVVDTLCNSLMGVNKMSLRNGMKASVVARRMSGDMCTSLGNGFSNLMLALFLAEKHGYTIEGFVEGDDGIFAVSGAKPGWLPDTGSSGECGLVLAYAALGFTIEVEQFRDPRMASFCGMIFGPDNSIIRDPRHFVRGFGWTQSFINGRSKIMHELLRAKALSACYETPNCPIVGPMARYALSITEGYAPRFVADGFHRYALDAYKAPQFCPSEGVRALFAEVYAIPIPVQYAIEKLISEGDMASVGVLMPPTSDDLWYTTKYIVTD